MLSIILGLSLLAVAVTAAVVLTRGALAAPEDDPSRRLVVYGSLAPGKSNHHVIAHLRGRWQDCTITGFMAPGGEYDLFTWQSDGPAVPAQLFESPDLPAEWKALDAFEGDDYLRVVVPVSVGGLVTMANLYVDGRSRNARTGSLISS